MPFGSGICCSGAWCIDTNAACHPVYAVFPRHKLPLAIRSMRCRSLCDLSHPALNASAIRSETHAR